MFKAVLEGPMFFGVDTHVQKVNLLPGFMTHDCLAVCRPGYGIVPEARSIHYDGTSVG